MLRMHELEKSVGLCNGPVEGLHKDRNCAVVTHPVLTESLFMGADDELSNPHRDALVGILSFLFDHAVYK